MRFLHYVAKTPENLEIVTTVGLTLGNWSGRAGGDADRLEELANARFSDAALGESACDRSITLDCYCGRLHALSSSRNVAQIECSEHAAVDVYAAMHGTASSDHGSALTMTWCPARRLCLYGAARPSEARVRALVDAHTDPLAATLIERCGLGYSDAAGWLPGEWGQPCDGTFC